MLTSLPPPVFVVHHTRTGIAALNVVTAALGTDPRTMGVEVHFAKTRDEVVCAALTEAGRGARVVIGWSFYSTDFAASAADLAWVKARTESTRGLLHLAGGVHATAEPEETLRAGFDLLALGEG